MEKEKFYTCRYDRAFKEVFMNGSNKDLLKSLLESVLGVGVNDIEYLNLESNVDNVNVKRKHFDLNLNTSIGRVQVEVNSTNKAYIHPRNMSYIGDTYSHHTLKGENYDEDTMIIQINFSYSLTDDKKYRVYKVQDEDGKLFVKNFLIYEFNMAKYKDIWYTKDKVEIEKNKYIIMLDLNEDELMELASNDKVVSKYMEELKRVNKKVEFREYMSAEEGNRKIQNSLMKEAIETGLAQGIAQGLEQGLEHGLEQGINKGKLEIALAMLNEKIDIIVIARCTGLSVDTINNIGTEAGV